MNWQDRLQAFKDSNPDLPEGPDSPAPHDRDHDDISSCPRLDISIERKGRGGKTATLITGWNLPDERLREIAAKLKQQLGAGGSARGGEVLIQGDRRQDILTRLTDMGFKARVI